MSGGAQSGRHGFRGETGERQQSNTQPGQEGPLLIKCPPERHIAVEFSDIFRELVSIADGRACIVVPLAGALQVHASAIEV
eukprot:508127-Pelagomonas_calceolata.AAC.8